MSAIYKSSPSVNDLRTIFSVKWPIMVINEGSRGITYKIDSKKLVKMYPVLDDANFQLTDKNVKSKAKKKKRMSRKKQRKMYQELLASGKVKNQAEIARKFGVSRAWVSKVLK